MVFNRFLISSLWIFFLFSCGIYKPIEVLPKEKLPEHFAIKYQANPPFLPKRPWWQTFGDKELNNLIEEAFRKNLDLKAGVARLIKAKAILKEATSFYFPSISLDYMLQTSKEPGFFGENKGTSYRLSVAASYEPDLWTRLRSSTKAALAQLKATQEDVLFFYLSLAAQVADAYYLSAALEMESILLTQTLNLLKERARLVEDLYVNGLIDVQAILDTRRQILELCVRKKEVDHNLAKARHALAVLVGRYPENAPRPSLANLPDLKEVFPIGLPSSVLLYRPDIKAAYWRVKVADAKVATAIADRFPHINLLADVGHSHTAFSIGDIVGSFWSIGLQAGLQIFEGGRKKARVEEEKVSLMEALFYYQQVILKAFQEVEDAISANLSAQERLKYLQQEVALLKDRLTLKLAKYEEGVSDYLPVLDTKIQLFETKRALILEKQCLISARISLYRALGGAWMKGYLTQTLRGLNAS